MLFQTIQLKTKAYISEGNGSIAKIYQEALPTSSSTEPRPSSIAQKRALDDLPGLPLYNQSLAS